MIAALIVSLLVGAGALAVALWLLRELREIRRGVNNVVLAEKSVLDTAFEHGRMVAMANARADRWETLHDALLAKNNRRRVANESADTPETKHG